MNVCWSLTMDKQRLFIMHILSFGERGQDMEMMVIKRDGRKVEYQRLRIVSAIEKAEKALNNHVSIANEISLKLESKLLKLKQSSISIEEIQDLVVECLNENHAYECAKVYENYRKQRTHQREIRGSLMKSIEKMTFSETSDEKRENANIDGNTSMGMMLQYGSTVSKNFAKHFLLKEEHSDLHDSGMIHIHDLDFYAMGTLTCCQINLSKLFKDGFSTGHGSLREPKDISSYTALAAIAIQSNQNDQHGGQSIPAFDFDMSEGVRKTFKKILAYECEILEDQFDKDTLNTLSQFELESLNLDELKDESIRKVLERVYKQTIKKTYQAMEALIHNLNTMHSRAGAQVPFSSLNFGTDTSQAGRIVNEQLLLAHESGLGNHETAIFPILIFKIKEGINFNPQDPNYDLFRLALRVSSKRLFPNFSFLDAPFNAKYYKANQVETEVTYMGCRTRVIGNQCGENQVNGRGNLSFTSINLVRLGIEYGLHYNKEADWKGFYSALDQVLHQVLDQLLTRLAYQSNKKLRHFPFLMGQGIWQGSDQLDLNDSVSSVLNQGTLSIGFIGLAECLKAMLGAHHGESNDAQQIGLSIINYLNQFCEKESLKRNLNITLLATPAEGLSGRFTAIDKAKFGVLEGITDRDYYTNSFHVPVYYSCSIEHKLAIEGPYHAITPAGHISYVEIDGDPSRNIDAMEDIVRLMRKANIGYGSINHPLDHDPVCGYRGVIKGHICPKCQRDEQEGVSFQRIRRITGYLVGTLDRFNQAKRSEVNQRVQHDSIS